MTTMQLPGHLTVTVGLRLLATLVFTLAPHSHLPAQRSLSELGSSGSFQGIESGQVTVEERETKTVRVVVTERLLCRDRQWTAVDGRTLTGALLAHRNSEAVDQSHTAHQITVIKDDRIRLKIGSGTYNLPLEKFSKKDREFVQKIAKALEQKGTKNEGHTSGGLSIGEQKAEN